MSEARLFDDPPVTIAEFEAFLAAQEDKRPWELVAGRIIGMTNPSQRHELIVSNLGVALKQAADKRNCHTFFGGMRVQRSEPGAGPGGGGGIDKPRPDLLVRCGAIEDRNFVTDPLVIVEVLSPSTMDNDRGDKLRFYKRLPTLAHIVLLYQDQMRAEHYRRIDTGWETLVLVHPDDPLELAALGCSIMLADAYAGL